MAMALVVRARAAKSISLIAAVAVTALCALTFAPSEASATRLKDLVNIKGVRGNSLQGFGIVTGLAGTGDSKGTGFSNQALANLLTRKGLRLTPGQIKSKNIAVVSVTAELPPFARNGDRYDVVVSSIGDAKSLQGGRLEITALEGIDGEIYMIADGSLVSGGLSASGGGSSSTVGTPNVARVSNGGRVEREVAYDFSKSGVITLSLKVADFTTASRVSQAINYALAQEAATTLDPRTISVRIPPAWKGRPAELIATIERVDVVPDRNARVVINERSGTIVIGEGVRVRTVAISQGNLSIEIKETRDASQPLPFSLGETARLSDTDIKITEENGKLSVLPGNVSIGELSRALNAMGVSPRDLASIFQALKGAGAIDAEIIIQ
jgi:flagellar P-ring protein FlgI